MFPYFLSAVAVLGTVSASVSASVSNDPKNPFFLNQHFPQRKQSPQPNPPIPFFYNPSKILNQPKIGEVSSKEQETYLKEKQAQQQQWEINVSNGQPGGVYISAPQYGYYPGSYPPQPYPGNYPYPQPGYPPSAGYPPQLPPPNYPSQQPPYPGYPQPGVPPPYPGYPQPGGLQPSNPDDAPFDEIQEQSDVHESSAVPDNGLNPGAEGFSWAPLSPSVITPYQDSLQKIKNTLNKNEENDSASINNNNPASINSNSSSINSNSASINSNTASINSNSASSSDNKTEILTSTTIISAPLSTTNIFAPSTTDYSGTTTNVPTTTTNGLLTTSYNHLATTNVEGTTHDQKTTVSPSERPSTDVSNVSSTNESTTSLPSNSTDNSTASSLLQYCKRPRGQFKSPTSCTCFINCWDGYAIEQSCPDNLAFNPEKEYCDYASDVNCPEGTNYTSSIDNQQGTNGVNQQGTNGENQQGTNNRLCPNGYGTYRNQSNCAGFYVCVAGTPVSFLCPEETNFNDRLKVCDWAYRVDCGGIPSYPAPNGPGCSGQNNSAESSNYNSTESSNYTSTESSKYNSTEPPSNCTSDLPPSQSIYNQNGTSSTLNTLNSTEYSTNPSVSGETPSTDTWTSSSTTKKSTDPATDTWTSSSTTKKSTDPATDTWTLSSTTQRSTDPPTDTWTLSSTTQRSTDPSTDTWTLSSTTQRSTDPSTDSSTLSPYAQGYTDPPTSSSTIQQPTDTSIDNSSVPWTSPSSLSELQTTSNNPFTVDVENPQSFPPADPIAYLHYGIRSLPESVVNSGVRCYSPTVLRLTPDCSAVTVCQNGYNYVVSCAGGLSYDSVSRTCVPAFRAIC